MPDDIVDEYVRLGDLVDIKVGAVSGADEIYKNSRGNAEFVCSYTNKTNKLKKMIFNIESELLYPYKEQLMQRKIRKFDENNWWEWGRKHHVSKEPRIYVNAKTRNKKPFFKNSSNYYDGSILALFPKVKIELSKLEALLNNIDWESQGFVSNNRYLFSQRSLTNSLIPKSMLSKSCSEQLMLTATYST